MNNQQRWMHHLVKLVKMQPLSLPKTWVYAHISLKGPFMPISDFLKGVREKVGHDILVLPSAAVVVPDEKGRVLFCLHSDKGIWVTPGGLIEPGELPAEAAARETFEETGLLVEITGLLGVFGGPELVIHYPNGDVASYVGTIFRGRMVGGELRADGIEVLDVKFLSRSEVEELPHAPWVGMAIDAIFTPTAEPCFQQSRWRPG
jgi:8-oxo-dGTP pyrophosphatase MutT (NUDIX family)